MSLCSDTACLLNFVNSVSFVLGKHIDTQADLCGQAATEGSGV